jgi:small subunit ribosomal protein S7
MRKTRAKKRPLLPDPRFNDPLVTRFVNNMMYDGKKSTAFKIFYDAIDLVSQRTGEANGLDQWKSALTNVMPHVEVRSRRVGGATFQIPQQIRPERKISVAMKWLIGYSRQRNEKSMAGKLAGEILAAAKKKVQPSKSAWIRTRWQKPTRHSHTSVSNRLRISRWLHATYYTPGTLVSWHTSMPERPLLRSVFFTTLA